MDYAVGRHHASYIQLRGKTLRQAACQNKDAIGCALHFSQEQAASKMIAIFLLFASTLSFFSLGPDMSKTPGRLCTEIDPYYMGMHYGIAKCKRKVSKEQKRIVGARYNVTDESTWLNYKFDHLIPLGIGGSNDNSNLWPQPNDAVQAIKDKVEQEVYNLLSTGRISQSEAIQIIWNCVNKEYSGGQQYSCTTVESCNGDM